MSKSVIFAKTRLGQDEIASRSGKLTPRERRLLIFTDGKRPVDELQRMLQVDDLRPLLERLAEAGLIERIGSARKTPAQPTSAPQLPTITVFRALPDPPDPRQLELARNYLVNSLKTFCSPQANQQLIAAALAAKTHDELRWQFEPWLHAITQTLQGKLRAEELRAHLLKII